MTKKAPIKIIHTPWFAGLCVFILVMMLTTGIALAAPEPQEETPDVSDLAQQCSECHLDVYAQWSTSPHANAYSDPYFQERWEGLGSPDECLSCHTTNFIASTGEFSEEGVHCEACHGQISPNHPPEIISIQADTEYCGKCHTTTLSEWKTTAHAPAGVGCMQCHDPHSQRNLFEVKDDLCINCHQQDMERYLEDTHIIKGIGCVDCHALVIPPEEVPNDGIVPTGHAFNITPATCVACHTDALHAGFSLPGFEDGPLSYNHTNGITETIGIDDTEAESTEDEMMTAEQQVQTLQAALASRNITTLFQGGIVGIVLGGSTAWIVSRNVRRSPGDETEEEENDEEKETE